MDFDCGRPGEAAAYVLGDLRGPALAEYERHLSSCEQCRDEVDLLDQAADSVSLLASAPPDPADEIVDDPEPIRPGVWAQERIEAVTAPRRPVFAPRGVPGGQHATEVVRESAGAAALSRAAFQRAALDEQSRRNTLSGLGSLPMPRFLKHPRGPRRSGSRRGVQMPRPAIVGLAALAVVAVMVVVLTKKGQSINYVHAEQAWQNGAAVLKLEGAQGQLLVVGMPAPPAGDHYELWAIKQGVRKEIPLNAGLELSKTGNGGAIVPGDIRTYLALTVYAEPLGGTKSPRGTPYVVADLRKLNEKKS